MLPYPDRFMTPDAQHRFYLLSLATATCLLISTLLYALNSIGMDVVFKYLSYLLLFAGLFLWFKAFETWSFPNDYAGKLPTEEQQNIGDLYRNMFYVETAIATLLAVSTFVWTNVTNHSPNEGYSHAILCVLVAVGCVLFGRRLANRIASWVFEVEKWGVMNQQGPADSSHPIIVILSEPGTRLYLLALN